MERLGHGLIYAQGLPRMELVVEKCVMGWRLISKALEYTIDYVWCFFPNDNSTIIKSKQQQQSLYN